MFVCTGIVKNNFANLDEGWNPDPEHVCVLVVTGEGMSDLLEKMAEDLVEWKKEDSPKMGYLANPGPAAGPVSWHTIEWGRIYETSSGMELPDYWPQSSNAWAAYEALIAEGKAETERERLAAAAKKESEAEARDRALYERLRARFGG